MLLVFTASIICKDLFHNEKNEKEVVCAEANAALPHFHNADICSLCDHDFSFSSIIEEYNNISFAFTFSIVTINSIAFYHPISTPQNPDTRGSPLSA